MMIGQLTIVANINQLEIGAATDIGNVRQVNEDTIYAAPIEASAENPHELVALLLVADGLGGHDAGEVASEMAKDALVDTFQASRPLDGSPTPLVHLLHQSILLANDRIHDWGANSMGSGRPGTTMTACAMLADRYIVGHVGDSRAYLITLDGTRQLTDDDSVVAQAVRQGMMTATQAKTSPFRNQLLRSVGTNSTVDPSLYKGEFAPGDILLLTSDGLSEYIDDQGLRDVFNDAVGLQDACDILVARAKERGGHDNISVVCARVGMWSASDVAKANAKKQTTKITKRPRLFNPFSRKPSGR